ncbi:DEAD/DEAH box helicase [Tropicimonas sp. IMCC34011]|uniref:DEAD/DEAH box helicase n=1 Tax=Tropicimonas sp. IMCC34011 TaxID=2248759 RepID=UPI001E4AF331|nr:DEAD/DEAH box helicase [Tropicimonas sp. IMCC34011]
MDFDMLGLDPRLLDALKRTNISEPTPIQAQAIPHAMNGRDVLGLAQTGTGKTAAFGLPLVHALMTTHGGRPTPKQPKSLILAPTRELVRQIADTLSHMTQGTQIRIQTITGGVSPGPQIRKMEKGCDVLVATPGRLIDLLEQGAVNLAGTPFLVLDEADQMLDLGFIHALRKIARLLPEDRQTMLFSATMPKQMNELANTYLRNPVRVEVSPPGRPADKIAQYIHFLDQSEKPALLADLLDEHRDERALVFARTKHGAERLMKGLDKSGFAAASIHGNKSQGQRLRALDGFRDGDIRVLVATDVAARGLDIPDVRHVYNYDLPNVPDAYVHRIGRTARAGASGRAVAFCSPEEIDLLRDIEKTTKLPIEVAGGERPTGPAPKKADGGGRGRRGGGGGGKPGGGGGRGQGHGQGARGKPGVTAAKPKRNRRRGRSSNAA